MLNDAELDEMNDNAPPLKRKIGRPMGSKDLPGKARAFTERDARAYALRIGQLLRDARLEAGISMSELGVATGAAPSTISRIENGQKDMRVSTLVKLAYAIGVSPNELLP